MFRAFNDQYGLRAVNEVLARLLEAVAAEMPADEVEAVWAFPPVRRDGREHAIAVVSRRAAEDRRRIYRARYSVGLAGAERGKIVVLLEQAAEGPPDLVPSVIDGVRRRADEAGDAELVDLTAWKAARDERPADG
jgi:GGDEF domain-containing protein